MSIRFGEDLPDVDGNIKRQLDDNNNKKSQEIDDDDVDM